ncbi:hypothetical protein GCM10009836_71290 [Pseudonocardia ailaonensis]|uniref:ESX-1 secretion-associated protein n=1 Tax=Pseudonocardia ailaonensis TaxID=367279 RepID=A0ABN2NPR8_9PSEU
MTGFRVDPDALDTRAAALERSEQNLASDTPVDVPLSADAYGVVGRLFAGAAIDASARAVSGIQAARRGLLASASRVRASAAAYREEDLSQALALERAARRPGR